MRARCCGEEARERSGWWHVACSRGRSGAQETTGETGRFLGATILGETRILDEARVLYETRIPDETGIPHEGLVPHEARTERSASGRCFVQGDRFVQRRKQDLGGGGNEEGRVEGIRCAFEDDGCAGWDAREERQERFGGEGVRRDGDQSDGT